MAKPKKWQCGYRDDAAKHEVTAIAEKLGIRPLTSWLLYLRGHRTPGEASAFLSMDSILFHDPFLMPDMEAACRRITDAIEHREPIVIYGDYDADGVTSVSVLYLFLKQNGAIVSYYIPSRLSEGYGVNRDAVSKLISERGARLIVTVDTGVTAVSEAAYALSLGCDMVVTDHHECPEVLPKAVAVINPKRQGSVYPFAELAGVGVAFKLISALSLYFRRCRGLPIDGALEAVCRDYLDLVAIGTIADVMPLRDENRLIVSMGLHEMEKNTRVGIAALIDASESTAAKKKAKRQLSSTLVSYTLAPRINAAGRIYEADRAVKLFLSSSREEADEIAAALCAVNTERQEEENTIMAQISAMVKNDPDLVNAPAIVLAADHWHQGVIGIVASRITERYNRPTILISFDDTTGKGSGRSIKGFNLVEALSACRMYLDQFGGHELAAGLSIQRQNFEEFRRQFCAYAKRHLSEEDYAMTLDIDCEIAPSEATIEQAEELCLLEPFGVENPAPQFRINGLTVIESKAIGSGKHTKMTLGYENQRFSCVYFGQSPVSLGFSAGDTVDIVCHLAVNAFMNNRSLQLTLRDIRFSDIAAITAAEERRRYENAVQNGEAPPEDIPTRNCFVSVFLRLKRSVPEGTGEINLHMLLRDLQSIKSASDPISYVKLRLVFDILSEIGVISLSPVETAREGLEKFMVTIHHLDKKADLEKSCLYKKLMKH